MKACSISARYVCTGIAAGMFAIAAAGASAQQLSVSGNTVTVSADGGFAGASPSISSTGLVGTVNNIPTVAGGFNVPVFSYTLEQSGVPDGSYTFSAGFVIDDDNSNRRIEILIPGIIMNFTSGVLSGSVSNPNVTVLGRNADGSVQLAGNFTSNAATFNGSTLTFNAKNQLDFIVAEGGILADIINTINTASSGHFTYKVFLKQTGGSPTLQFGVNALASFTAFPRIQTTCAANTNSQTTSQFLLNSNQLAATFNLAHGLQGQFNFAGASSSAGAAPAAFTETCTTGGDTTTPPPTTEDSVEENATATDDLLNSVDSGTIDENTVSELDTLVTSTTTVVTTLVEDIADGTVEPTVAITQISTLNKQLQAISTVSSAGQTVSISTIVSVITNTARLNRVLGTRTLTSEERTNLRSALSATFQNIASLFRGLKGKFGLLVSTDPLTDFSAITADTTIADVTSVVNEIQTLATDALNIEGIVLDETFAADIRDVSQSALELILAPLGAELGLTVSFQDDATTRSLLTGNPALLNRVLDTAMVALGVNARIDTTTTQAALETAGLTSNDALELTTSLANFVKADDISIQQGEDSVLVSDLLRSTLGASALAIDSDSGVFTVTIDGIDFSGFVNLLAASPGALPEGLTVLPDGSAVMVGGGFTFGITFAPHQVVPFAGAVAAATVLNTTITDNGTLVLTDADTGTRFVGRLTYDLGSGTSGASVTFQEPTGDPASPDFLFTANYTDGTSQDVLPAVFDTRFYDSLARMGFQVSVDIANGVLTIDGFRFRPDFFIEPLTASDSMFLSENADATGVAYLPMDPNGDGIIDYQVTTTAGKQLVYGLP